MSPKRSEGEESEYPFFEGDGSSSDEWGDYGVAGDDYEGPPVFDDDQYEEELMPVYDTDIEDVIEEEEGFVGKGGFGWEEDNIKDVVVVANDLCSSMTQTTLNVDFEEDINTKSHELMSFEKSILIKGLISMQRGFFTTKGRGSGIFVKEKGLSMDDGHDLGNGGEASGFVTSNVAGNGVDVNVPKESVSVVNERLNNSVYGFFLGKRVAYPVVENYLSYRGPMLIRNVSLTLKQWTLDANIIKDDVCNIPVWVKFHVVPIAAFTEDGLSAIATKLGSPLMLYYYTNLLFSGEGFTTSTIRVEYEWTPPRFSEFKPARRPPVGLKPKSTFVYFTVSRKKATNPNGNPKVQTDNKATTPVFNSFDALRTLVDEEDRGDEHGKPLELKVKNEASASKPSTSIGDQFIESHDDEVEFPNNENFRYMSSTGGGDFCEDDLDFYDGYEAMNLVVFNCAFAVTYIIKGVIEQGFLSQKESGVGRGVKEKQSSMEDKEKNGVAPSANKDSGAPFVTIASGTTLVHKRRIRLRPARALMEFVVGGADVELKDNIVVAMPKIVREGFYTCIVHVEYEWKPPRCACCKVFVHVQDECTKIIDSDVVKNMKQPSQATRGVLVGPKPTIEVSNSNPFDVLNSVENNVDLGINGGTSNLASKKANSSGSSFWNIESSSISTTPLVEKIDKIERLIIDGKVTLVDDEGKPLTKVDSLGDHDSEDEVTSVDNDMANFLALKKVGYGTNSLLEQWKESYMNGDYDFDPYDDHMYKGHDIPNKIQDICDNLDIKVRGHKKK
ncbi:hypothetical protein Tco_0370904 [Tanacetum coccineum]